MKRIAFLAPAAIAGITVAAAAVAFDLAATLTYALIGVVGFLVLLGGALKDLEVSFKRRKVVEVHQATIRAEQPDGPISRGVGVSKTLDEQRLIGGNPIWISASRTRLETLFPKKPKKRGKILRLAHWTDLIPGSHA